MTQMSGAESRLSRDDPPALLAATPKDGLLLVRVVAPQLTAVRSIDRLERELTTLLERHEEPRWILDFAGVTFIVTMAISALLVIMKRLRSKGGDLAIIGLETSIYRMFKLMKLDQVFIVADTREAAQAALRA